MPIAKTASMSIVLAAALCLGLPAQAQQASAGAPAAKAPATALSRDSRNALNRLTAQSSTAKALEEQATAVLVFPSIKKAGFVVGGQYGEGTLFRGGKADGLLQHRRAFPTGCRPARKPTAMRCSS